jgi:hypothetical protein
MPVTPEVYESVMELNAGMCSECYSTVDPQLHHRFENHKWRAEKYPLFIHSPFNLICLCGPLGLNCHEAMKHKYRITEREADVFEAYLRNLKEGGVNEV